MKRYTREEFANICMDVFGEEADDTVLDLLVMIQDLHENAYKNGYDAGLKEIYSSTANEAVIKNGKTIVFQGCNLCVSELDGYIGVLVEINGKYWGFGKRGCNIDDVMADLEKVGIVPIDVVSEGGASND